MVTQPRPADLRGLNRLVFAGIAGLVDLVESVHLNISSLPGIVGGLRRGKTSGMTGLVYRSIHGTAAMVEYGLDRLLAGLAPLLGESSGWPGREASLSALNGVLGDYLAASGSPFAIPMSLRQEGHALPTPATALRNAMPSATNKVVVLVHGLCMNDLQWHRNGHDHCAALARDLGYTPIYLHYNSGRHISTNGRELSELIQSLVDAWPVSLNEVTVIGHSMGGLLARSACHYADAAGHTWRQRLSALICLGSPHHGAPLERGGHWVDVILGISPYTAPFARLGKIRSAGITDLRYGNLVDEDWEGRDRFDRSPDRRHPVRLPENVRCYAVAATLAKRESRGRRGPIGDGVVPVDSALGRHDDARLCVAFPQSRQWIGYAMNHLDLLSRREVYAQIRQWLSSPA